jgi:hypothetical protein
MELIYLEVPRIQIKVVAASLCELVPEGNPFLKRGKKQRDV